MVYTTPDYVYIGSSSPFNNVWLQMSTVSSTDAGKAVVEVRYNRTWVNAVDIIDETNGMQADGRLSWALEIFSGWEREQKSADVGLAGTNIYDRYWLRISWPNAFNCSLSYVGQKFSNDSCLDREYPDLTQASVLDNFKAGKLDWNDQHFLAAESIVKDLKSRQVIVDKAQIFDWSVFEDAATHRVAEIIYGAFGLPYVEHAKSAHLKYEKAISGKLLNLDDDRSGKVTEVEQSTSSQGWLSR
jgi:hypothetical protein